MLLRLRIEDEVLVDTVPYLRNSLNLRTVPSPFRSSGGPRKYLGTYLTYRQVTCLIGSIIFFLMVFIPPILIAVN